MVTAINSTQVLKDLPFPPGKMPPGLEKQNPPMTTSH